MNVDAQSPHRTPSPIPGRRPVGRRAAYPLQDDWDDEAEGDLPSVSSPPTTSWRHQTASIPVTELDDEDDLPTTPQRVDSYAPQQPQPEQAPEPTWPPTWSEPEPTPEPPQYYQPDPEPYRSYQSRYDEPPYAPPAPAPQPEPIAEPIPEPQPEPQYEWTPSWEERTQAWAPEEFSDLLSDPNDRNEQEQTSTGLFSAEPYVDRYAETLPVNDQYADELLGSDALGAGTLPIDPEISPAFPNEVLDHASEGGYGQQLQEQEYDPLADDPVARWEPAPPPRPRTEERPLFADDAYTLPQRMAQRDLEREQQQHHQPPQQPRQVDLPPVQLTSADRAGRPERKPRASGMSGWLGILISVGASLVTAGLDLMLTNQLGLFFMLSSILTAFGVAAAVRRPDVFTAGVLPPLAALATFIVLGALVPMRLSGITDRPTAILAALASESWTLVAATAIALGTIAVRVALTRPPKQAEEEEPPERQPYRTAA